MDWRGRRYYLVSFSWEAYQMRIKNIKMLSGKLTPYKNIPKQPDELVPRSTYQFMIGVDYKKAEAVENEMKKLLKHYESVEKKDFNTIIDFHVRFEEIHPFQDGNGRVGRMILFKECLRYNIVPFIVYDDKKLFYYRGIKEYHYEKGFMIDTCLSFQDQYRNLLKYFRITEECDKK